MEDFFTAVSNFGFPIVVAGYLLLRFENKIEKLDGTINQLQGSIKELIAEVHGNDRRSNNQR